MDFLANSVLQVPKFCAGILVESEKVVFTARIFINRSL